MSTNNQQQIDDKLNRSKILDTLNRNYFVSAGAGSGKTTSLVGRMVNMIINGVDGKDVDVSEICTITFTKVAANEFKERFQKELSNRLIEKDKSGVLVYSDPKIREKLSNAIKDIDLAFMGTIDSFCEKLIKEYPLQAKVPASSKLYEQDEINIKYLKFYREIEHLDDSNTLKEKYKTFTRLNGENSRDIFIKFIPFLCSNRDGVLQYTPQTEKDFEKVFKDEKTVLTSLQKLDPSYFSKNKYDEMQKKYNSFKNIINKNWNFQIGGVLKYINEINKATIKFVMDPCVEYPGLNIDYMFENTSTVAGKLSLKLSDKLIAKIQDYIYNLSMEFIVAAKEFILDSLKKTGTFNFYDNLYYVKEMLKEDASTENHTLIKNIQRKYKYYFLDESQDTDPLQIQIFFYLSAEVIKKDWFDCVPYKGSIFIVGDEKQSIYKFKGADINSYENVKKIFEKLGSSNSEVLPLTRNYRSRNKLIDYFNSTFSKMFEEDKKIGTEQCDYPLIPLNDQADDPNTNKNELFEGAYYFNCSKAEPDHLLIPNIINNLMTNYKIYREYFVVNENNEKEKRFKIDQIKYSDFMILCRKDRIPLYVNALKKYGIGSTISGKINFDECELLTFVKYCLQYITSIDIDTKNVAVVGLLSSKLFEYNVQQINDSQNNKFNNNDIKKVINIIDDFYKKYSSSPSLFINKIIQNEEILDRVPQDNLNVLYFVINLIKEKEKDGRISSFEEAYDFVTFLCEEKNEYNHNLSFTDKEDKVFIANIHQVKGDQRQIVILADNQRKNMPFDESYADYLNRKMYYFKLLGGPQGNSSLLVNNQFPLEQELNKRLEGFENTRILYVAATRAQSAFILSIPEKEKGVDTIFGIQLKNDDPKLMRPINDLRYSTSLKQVDPNIIDTSKALSVNENDLFKEINDESYSIINPSKEVKHDQLGNADDFVSSIIYCKNDIEDDIEIDTDDSKSIATTAGSIVHRFLELLSLSKLTSDYQKVAKFTVNEFHLDDNARKIMQECLCNIYEVESKKSNGLFDIIKHSKNFYTEVPFSYYIINKGKVEIKTGFIDLVYEDNNGWHIIDYKTNDSGDGLDKLYKNQLDIYVEAYKRISGFDVDAHTYHIDIKEYKDKLYDC